MAQRDTSSGCSRLYYCHAEGTGSARGDATMGIRYRLLGQEDRLGKSIKTLPERAGGQ